METFECIIVIGSIVSAVAAFVIALYAIRSHRLAESNTRLTQELGRMSQEMDNRHLRTLQHLAAATLAGGIGGGNIDEATKWFRSYLKRIEEQSEINSSTK